MLSAVLIAHSNMMLQMYLKAGNSNLQVFHCDFKGKLQIIILSILVYTSNYEKV